MPDRTPPPHVGGDNKTTQGDCNETTRIHLRHSWTAAAQLARLPAAQAQAIATLKMMIPANPGGGWDQTGR